MGRPTIVKLLLWLSAGTATLFAVLLALLFFVDANLYRAQIERQVSTAFGREVVLEGALSLEPSLIPRLVVNGLKISNPDWASRPFLAVVDKFDIRVGLVPLLQGDLQIVALEFHGVDLLLETAPGGVNNFTFGGAGESTALPAIEHLLLYDTTIAFARPDSPVKRLQLEKATARKVPGQPIELEARTTVNALPVTISLRGEPPGEEQPHNPWKITLLGEAGDLSLKIEGHPAALTDWRQGGYRLDLKGRRLGELGTLFGYPMPAAESFELGANLRFGLDERLTLSDLSGRFGGSDIRGNLHWDPRTDPPVVKIQLASQQLDSGDLGFVNPPTGDADQADRDYLNRPFKPGLPGGADLDVEVRVQRLDGLAKGVRDLLVVAQADQQQLRLATVKVTLDDAHITASATLPWGERLTTLAPGAVDVKTLLQHTELDLRAQAPKAAYQYTGSLLGRPMDVTLAGIQATARPHKAVTITAEAALNDKPVSLNLRAEPLAALVQRPTGPWQALALEVRGEDIRLDASGSVARPFEAAGFDVSYALSGDDIDALLPLRGAWSFSGHYADHPDHRLFDELKLSLGGSDLGGRIAFYPDEQRPRWVADLDADRIDLAEILPVTRGDTAAAGGWDRPLGIGGFANHDLEVELRVRHLQGLNKPVRNLRLRAQAGANSLNLSPVEATLDGIRLDGRVQLPWGERLITRGKNGLSVRGLIQRADLQLNARPPEGTLRHSTILMGHPFEFELTEFEADARPGEVVQVDATVLLDDTALQVNLRTEPLAQLLQRPAGPWRNLALEVRGKDTRLEASGSVDHPFEVSGFDLRYTLRGAEVNTLLPVVNLMLPLEGAYSLTGHFADQPDRLLFDRLKIESGGSDISGDILVHQDKQRPKVIANFSSEQIYFSKLLPVNETDPTTDAEPRLIPDYNLPIERLREFDGELSFTGKRLRTTAGDLGDIRFKATLQDGVFRMEPFEVRGWAGAQITSGITIDASQEPPTMDWQWVARQLNYGVLLEQAGFAETVKGTLDITLHLSGKGRTRREFLGNADGQLIIVGQEGQFASRRLDLWGSDLVTTMLSSEWRSEDVTDLNCVVARIRIEDGLASSDQFIIDTQRITIAATGTLDLESEKLNLILAPRPKRTSLVSLTSPAHVTGTLAAPEVAVTVLPRNRIAAAGTGVLAGLVNPGYLIFTFSQTRSRQANPCAAAVEEAMAVKGGGNKTDDIAP